MVGTQMNRSQHLCIVIVEFYGRCSESNSRQYTICQEEHDAHATVIRIRTITFSIFFFSFFNNCFSLMNSFAFSVRQTKRFHSFFFSHSISLYRIDIVGDWPDWLIVRRQYKSNCWRHFCRWKHHHQRTIDIVIIHKICLVGGASESWYKKATSCSVFAVLQIYLYRKMQCANTQNCFAPVHFSHRQLATIASIIFNGFGTKYALAYCYYCYCVNRCCY